MYIKLDISEERIREAYSWYIEDYDRTLDQAGERLGMSKAGISYRFKKLGLSIKPKRQSKAKLLTLTCEQCNQSFEIPESQYRSRIKQQGHIRFCSLSCFGIANLKPERYITLNCSYCGGEFTKRKDHLTDNNYCSRKCTGLARQEPNAKWRDPAQIKAYMQEYTRKNRVTLNRKKLDYSIQHREQKRASQRRHWQKNKAYYAFAARARYKKIRLGEFNEQEWEAIKAKYNYTCLCCYRQEPEIKLTMDHINPLALGGIHHLSNIQPLCMSCNARKGKKYIDYRPLFQYQHYAFRLVKV